MTDLGGRSIALPTVSGPCSGFALLPSVTTSRRYLEATMDGTAGPTCAFISSAKRALSAAARREPLV